MPASKATKKSTTTAAKKSLSRNTTSRQMTGSVALSRKTTSENMMHDANTSFPSRIISYLKSRRKYLFFIVGSVLVIFLVYYYKQVFVVAIVNGQPITRLSYYQELERQAGEQALNTIITKMLVTQEAQKQNVTVSDEEVDKEIKAIEERLKSQNQNLDTLLLFQGLTRDGLKDQLRLQKMAEKMASKDVKVSDTEIDEFLKANPPAEGAGVSSNEQRDKAREQIQTQKSSESIQKWLDGLRSKANIQRFVYFNTTPPPPPQQ